MKLRSKGDTIVEVLLALTVLSTILVAGYSISTRSLNGVRISQERGEALKIAEAEYEQLRFYVPQIDNATFTNISSLNASQDGFCMKTDPSTGNFIDGTSFFDLPSNDVKKLSEYSADCKRGTRYYVAITPTQSSSLTFTDGKTGKETNFSINVYWDRSGGGDVQQLTLSYKVIKND